MQPTSNLQPTINPPTKTLPTHPAPHPPSFIKNFWEGFKEVLGSKHVIKSLDKCDFTPIYDWHAAEREKKKNVTKEVRLVGGGWLGWLVGWVLPVGWEGWWAVDWLAGRFSWLWFGPSSRCEATKRVLAAAAPVRPTAV